ncbi:MAG: ankyrin repeat domain-containing protein [Armatimonadota bacterium]
MNRFIKKSLLALALIVIGVLVITAHKYYVNVTTSKSYLLYLESDNGIAMDRLLKKSPWLVNWTNTKCKDKSNLMHAVANHKYQVSKALLTNGAQVNAIDRDGETALMYSITAHDIDMMKLLIASGANVNQRNRFGDTPVITAVCVNDLSAVKLLIDNHADINAVNHYGMTPLHEAAGTRPTNNTLALIAYLLAHGAVIDTPDTTGYTPLHGAVCQSNFMVVRLLLAHGADATVKTKKGETPAQLAKRLHSDAAILRELAK